MEQGGLGTSSALIEVVSKSINQLGETQMDKALIAAEIAAHQKKIAELEQSLIDFDSLIENNQYESHDDAEGSITKRFRGIAREACEGAYNYGDDFYTQRYQIAGNPNVFKATVTFEYNRHDKTYYYIDGMDYSYAEV